MTIENKTDNQTMIVDVRQLVPLDEAESYILCLNQNTHLIVQMLHSFYGSWRNRYTQNSEVKPYLQPTDEEYRLVLDTFDQGEMELTQMTCLDDLVEAINDLGLKLDTVNQNLVSVANNSGCCGSSSGGAGTNQDEPLPYDEDAIPDTPPEGFEDFAEYREHKCNAADFLLDTLVTDLQRWSVLSIVGLLLSGLASAIAVVTLTPIPFDDLLFIAGVIIVGGLLLSYLAELSVIINSNLSDLICELYEAPNAESGRNSLITAIEALIDAQSWTETIKDQVKSILPRMITTNAVNRLFEPGAQFEGDGDCSDCFSGCTPLTSGLTIDYGTGSHVGDGVWEIASVFAAGWPCGANAQEVAVYLIPEGFYLVTAEIISGSPAACGTDIYHAFEGLGSPYSGVEGSGNAGFTPGQSLGSLYVLSDGAFTIRLTLCQMPE